MRKHLAAILIGISTMLASSVALAMPSIGMLPGASAPIDYVNYTKDLTTPADSGVLAITEANTASALESETDIPDGDGIFSLQSAGLASTVSYRSNVSFGNDEATMSALYQSKALDRYDKHVLK